MENDIIKRVRDFVEYECKKPTSKYGYEPFDNHFVPTVEYARKLAIEFGADLEIVTIAAWIHDIGSIMNGRENHHITGAKIAEEKLRAFKYPEDRVQMVKKCVLHHRGSQKIKSQSLEEQIIAEADAMSAFDNVPGLFKAAFVYEGLDQKAAKKSVLEKLNNKWNQLGFEKSQQLLRPKYDAITVLFGK
ncbi:MAG: hypothetical protein ACD_9C00208G0002 [uncultured bacterium]|nr:MAG: hypothetical protein ACD_9C00208G0002 [uncultured bacterium]